MASWRRGHSREASGDAWDRTGAFQDGGWVGCSRGGHRDEDAGRDGGRVDNRPRTGGGTPRNGSGPLGKCPLPATGVPRGEGLGTWGQWQGQRAGAWGPRGLDLRPPLTSAEDRACWAQPRHQRPAWRRDGRDERPRERISQWPKRPPRAPWQRRARSPGRMEPVLTPCTAPQWGWGLVNQLSRRPSPALPSLSPEAARGTQKEAGVGWVALGWRGGQGAGAGPRRVSSQLPCTPTAGPGPVDGGLGVPWHLRP